MNKRKETAISGQLQRGVMKPADKKQEEIDEYCRVADIYLMSSQWTLSKIKDDGGASSYNPEVVDQVIDKLKRAKKEMEKARAAKYSKVL